MDGLEPGRKNERWTIFGRTYCYIRQDIGGSAL
jgi:hypothetical protein